MYFSKIKCSCCGAQYDELSRECPTCHHKNIFIEKGTFKNCKAIFLPPFSQLFLFLFGFLGFQLIGGIITAIIEVKLKSILHGNEQLALEYLKLPKTNMIITFSTYIILFTIFILFLLKFINLIAESFLFIKILLIGIGFGILAIFLSSAYSIIASLFFKDLPNNQNQSILESIISIYPFSSVILFGLIGPFCEEITYRLGLYSLLRRINKIIAYIITILIFSLIHFDWNCLFPYDKTKFLIELINLPSYFIGAFLLCYCYEKFSLGCSTYAHMTNNFVSVILIIIEKALAHGK